MKKFDFIVAGSGFSGSVTAMALVKSGYSVCLIEKEKHPRFAVGESSTPIADMILRDLADEYDLPFLKKLSRYGEWQEYYPEVVCGLKRGFSYYLHKKGEKFTSDKNHSRELLVAASENDQNSDTNWLRSDVDHFLVKKAVETGVTYVDQTEVQKLSRNAKKEMWTVFLETPEQMEEMECEWIIDATGCPSFSTRFFNTKSSSKGFETNSSAVFTHFEHVNHWSGYLDKHSFKTSDYPYNPDYSALHHLLEEGWMWMLRFNNGRLSAGILLDGNRNQLRLKKEPVKVWNSIISQYPSLNELFEGCQISKQPGHFFITERLQRRLNKLYGNGWVVLPHTAGFVDPLHSTGIAHTLSGVEMLLSLLKKNQTKKERVYELMNYQDKVFNELSFIDLLVSLCYQTRAHFDLFTASAMLYFVASVQYEQNRLRGDIPDTFLCAGNRKIREIVEKTFDEIQTIDLNTIAEKEIELFVDKIRRRIDPYNSAGLLDYNSNNMYRHTAIEL